MPRMSGTAKANAATISTPVSEISAIIRASCAVNVA
jgi:hypothetical protein